MHAAASQIADLTVLGVLLLASYLGLALIVQRGFARVLARKTAPPVRSRPVAAIITCKGDDPELAARLEAIVAQDCERIEYLFALGAAADPALPAIRRLQAAHPEKKIRIVIGDTSRRSSQRNANVVAAIDTLDEVPEIIAVLSGTLFIGPHVVRRLAEELSDPAVGASCSYRHFIDGDGGLVEAVCRDWSLVSLCAFARDASRFAWGGTFAIRRQVFAASGVRELWLKSICDDCTLTTRLRELGLRVEFLPDCLALQRNRYGTWPRLFQFAVRQMQYTYLYDPRRWWPLAINAVLSLGTLLVGLVGSAFAPGRFLPLLAFWLLQAFAAKLAIDKPLGDVLAASGIAAPARGLVGLMLPPVVTAVFHLSVLVPPLLREQVWMGDRFLIRAPFDIDVVPAEGT